MQRGTDPAPLRVLRLLEAMVGGVVDGLTPREIIRLTGYTASNTSRDLRTLEAAGWARQLPGGRWTLTEKPAALLKIYGLHLQSLTEQAREFDLRANARARQL